MDIPTAVEQYGKLNPLVSKRDHAIVSAIIENVGAAAVGALAASQLEYVTDRAVIETIAKAFVDAVEANTEEVPKPRGVSHLPEAEIRDDGHTYVNDERID